MFLLCTVNPFIFCSPMNRRPAEQLNPVWSATQQKRVQQNRCSSRRGKRTAPPAELTRSNSIVLATLTLPVHPREPLTLHFLRVLRALRTIRVARKHPLRHEDDERAENKVMVTWQSSCFPRHATIRAVSFFNANLLVARVGSNAYLGHINKTESYNVSWRSEKSWIGFSKQFRETHPEAVKKASTSFKPTNYVTNMVFLWAIPCE